MRSLAVRRAEPVEITLVNRLPEATAIHWHGMELDSYFDGVHGWSGAGTRVTPLIDPGASFTVRMTPPRTGTFIYHTHLHDMSQLTAGLYGPLLVLEPGQQFDPRTDHVFTVGWDGPAQPPRLVVNGNTVAPPLVLTAGTSHRLRFINVGAAQLVRITLLRDSVPTRWQPIAKDGIAPPAWLASPRNAVMVVRVGETFDAEFRPAPGEYVLEVRRPSDGRLYFRQVLTAR